MIDCNMFNSRHILCLCLLSFIFSCQGLPWNKTSKRELLEQRVRQYIQIRGTDDVARLYSFYSPTYKKEIPFETFKGRHKFETKETVLESIEYIDGADTAKIVISSTFELMGYHFKKSGMVQKWVFHDDNWYFDPKKASLNDLIAPTHRPKRPKNKP